MIEPRSSEAGTTVGYLVSDLLVTASPHILMSLDSNGRGGPTHVVLALMVRLSRHLGERILPNVQLSPVCIYPYTMAACFGQAAEKPLEGIVALL